MKNNHTDIEYYQQNRLEILERIKILRKVKQIRNGEIYNKHIYLNDDFSIKVNDLLKGIDYYDKVLQERRINKKIKRIIINGNKERKKKIKKVIRNKLVYDDNFILHFD